MPLQTRPETSHPGTAARPRYYGKYRAVVLDHVDPLRLGRVQVQVPEVYGAGGGRWAMPCVPVAGRQSGVFLLPPIGAPVWVEFEQGDAELPVWVGGYWVDADELPPLAHAGQAIAPGLLLQTPNQHAIAISDLPGSDGGILLRSRSGASIAITDAGITISNGRGASIVLAGAMVTINDGALTVV
ncbi:phage baseplate assembly protein V [Lysobacter sp. 5GHs7-4]|uniref:phage baseplate assembly protein V n=1 Tax=Lysobacter sp. 5GHs7-4 TaxID=2904253 RepID=UPI001E2C4548|nr:phage baseplate assembly protein V [Lysobacter sp. 5GHs7-4]UHQ25074.1 phage baseplate assembly protein V [Lysobacter sp. 5GHs7-4]